jgi:site-specific DNA-methyltransferase (adenine-specific)
MTATSRFGVGRRESHDARDFYARFRPPELSADDDVKPPFELDEPLVCADARQMQLLDNSVALVVTSPPYFAGKEYEEALGSNGVPATYLEYLQLLRDVFAECVRVLEPGGRIAVNVANLGRQPYRSLSADVIRILQDDLGLLLRGEVVWAKAEAASGSCAWGSFRSAANPVLRDVTERVVIASKGRFDRAITQAARRLRGLPCESAISTDEFLDATLDLWRIPSESATRVGHPAPFPVELPLRLIDLYTFRGDLVLDPFVGAGATAVAAARRGRRFAGYDTEESYICIARQRVQEEQARVAASGDHDHDRATANGKATRALALAMVERAGFTVLEVDRKLPGLGVSIGIVAADRDGQPWHFDITGAYTNTGDGLCRADTLWKCLGRVSVFAARQVRPLILLTSILPPRRSSGDRALRALGPECVFDGIEILSYEGQSRLHGYARGGHGQRPATGFWSPEELTTLSRRRRPLLARLSGAPPPPTRGAATRGAAGSARSVRVREDRAK